jgi:hypothetical protein
VLATSTLVRYGADSHVISLRKDANGSADGADGSADSLDMNLAYFPLSLKLSYGTSSVVILVVINYSITR